MIDIIDMIDMIDLHTWAVLYLKAKSGILDNKYWNTRLGSEIGVIANPLKPEGKYVYDKF